MTCAVRHGTVLFSTMTAPGLAIKAMERAAASNIEMSVAAPAPSPSVLVGVLTLKNTMSAAEICSSQSEEKNRLGCRAGRVLCLWKLLIPLNSTALAPSRAIRTTSTRPGSWIGRCLDLHRLMRSSFRSTTVTLICGLQYARTAAVGPPSSIDCDQHSLYH